MSVRVRLIPMHMITPFRAHFSRDLARRSIDTTRRNDGIGSMIVRAHRIIAKHRKHKHRDHVEIRSVRQRSMTAPPDILLNTC